MFTLEEHTRDRERRHPQYARKAAPENAARYEAMRLMAEEISALEEAALVELEQLGNVEPPFDTAGAEDWPESWGDFEPWHQAVNDYTEVMGELCTDEVLGLA